MPIVSDTITFAGLDSPIAPLGVGCWAWGDKSTWGMGGYDAALTEASIAEAWDASFDAGVTLFDTAEIYGPLTDEELVGEALRPVRNRVVIATKVGFRVEGTT